jgi:hypothetical protein
VQAARERSGRVSLSPRVTRIRNVGMKGINFDVRDGSKEARQWLAVPLPGPEGEPYEYDHQLPIVEETEAWKRAGATAPQVVAARLLSEAEVQNHFILQNPPSKKW